MNPVERAKRFREIFRAAKEKGEDVWAVANPPPHDVRSAWQVVVEIRGHRIPPIKLGDPVCLTFGGAPIDALETSDDLHKHFHRGAINLLSDAEARALFDRRAALLRVSPDELHEEALRNSMLAPSYDAESNQLPEQAPAPEQTITPLVLQLMADSNTSRPVNEQRPIKEILASLDANAVVLTKADWDYIIGFPTFPEVKKFAQTQRAQLG